jgi:hypothetical protein
MFCVLITLIGIFVRFSPFFDKKTWKGAKKYQ